MASQDATMMGGPEVTLDQQLEHKKRKSDRACDFCRRRKSRCDGDQVSRKSCSNCTLNNLQCTFHDTAKRQVISKTYVESLERRIEELEGMLERQQSLSPTRSADSPASTHTSASCPLSQEQLREMYCAVIRDDQRSKIPPYISSETIEEDADRGHGEFNPQDDDLNTTFRHLRLGPSFNRFLGKSSTAHLVLKIFSLKKKNSGEPYRVPPTFLDGRRPRYWQPHPWEYSLLQTEPARYSFPDEDLAKELIDLYFENVQPYFPILHRPTLEQGMRASEHLKDHNFGAIVLLVCALGARFSEDPRVLSKEYPSETHSRGWEWFSQAEKERRPVYTAPTLHEMQSFCLSIVFMLAASNLMAQHIWTRVGTGIRYIQDTGAHRRTTRKIPTNSDELWNRAVWLLIVLDRHLSSILGRSTAIQDEVFDIRYPMECDDEYWYNPDNPEESWKQPADKPSIVSGFVTYIKLTRMVEIAIRTIYGINKSGVISKFMGEEWERNVVRELDSALNRWVENVPEHLRWNPEQPDFRFLNQAAYLEAAYRQTQILIHRPFITSSKPSSQLALPSLTICTTAARACAHVLDQQRHKTGKALPYAMFPASISATVLLISMFSRCEPTRSRRDQLKELKEIHLMMDYLKSLEDRWVTAGRTWDVLNELCHFGDMPNSQLGKRAREGADAEQPSRRSSSHVRSETAFKAVDALSPSSFTASPTFASPPSDQPTAMPPPSRNILPALGNTVRDDMPSFADLYPEQAIGRGHAFGALPNAMQPEGSAWFPPGGNGAERGTMGSMERGSMNSMDFSQSAWMFGDTSTAPSQPPGFGDSAAVNEFAGGGLDPDSMAIWSAVPSAYDSNDWMTYLAGLAEAANEQSNAQFAEQGMGAQDGNLSAFPMPPGGAGFPS